MKLFLCAALLSTASFAFGQSFEFSVSGGESQLSKTGSNLGSLTGVPGSGDNVTLDNGFNITFAMTLNPWKHFGTDFGYAYNRSHLLIGGQDSGGMAIHQGFFDGLLYLTKEGSRIRPYGAAGVQFSNFTPPGASAQYGGGQNKFGINYGAGIKLKVTGMWFLRADWRQFNTGKPDFNAIPGVSGRLVQNEYTVGVGVGF